MDTDSDPLFEQRRFGVEESSIHGLELHVPGGIALRATWLFLFLVNHQKLVITSTSAH